MKILKPGGLNNITIIFICIFSFTLWFCIFILAIYEHLAFEEWTNHRVIELKLAPYSLLNRLSAVLHEQSSRTHLTSKMSSTENNAEVAVEKVKENNDKPAADAKAEIKGTKRPAEEKGDDVKKQKKEENGEEEEVEDEEDVEGEEEEEEEEIPEGEEEEEEEAEGEGEGEDGDEDDDA
ncbi:hypothetical protein B566_EDAN017519 [Ephemera danica]|nr:hypothetical protein B566_EDAN017519 [Ephemera danica]